MNSTANDNGASAAPKSRLYISDEEIPALFYDWKSFYRQPSEHLNKIRDIVQVVTATLENLQYLAEMQPVGYVFETESEEDRFFAHVDEMATTFVDCVADTSLPEPLFRSLSNAILAVAPNPTSVYFHRAAEAHYRHQTEISALINAAET